jgi:hypothetical protein
MSPLFIQPGRLSSISYVLVFLKLFSEAGSEITAFSDCLQLYKVLFYDISTLSFSSPGHADTPG